MKKSGKSDDHASVGEVLTDSKTYKSSGPISDRTVVHILADTANELPPKMVGRVVKLYLDSLPPLERLQKYEAFAEHFGIEWLGRKFKECAAERLARIKK